jgi:hypothetical protein
LTESSRPVMKAPVNPTPIRCDPYLVLIRK